MDMGVYIILSLIVLAVSWFWIAWATRFEERAKRYGLTVMIVAPITLVATIAVIAVMVAGLFVG